MDKSGGKKQHYPLTLTHKPLNFVSRNQPLINTTKKMEATNILTNEAFYKLFTGAVEVLEGDRAVIAVNIARLLPNNMEEDALRDAEISLEAWALAGRIWSVKAILLSNICGDAARDSGTRQYTIDRLEYYFKELGICG